MKMRRVLNSFAVLGAFLAIVPSAGAHRLDEYLQATLLSVDLEHVDLEIELTAGVAKASEVFSWIDSNRDKSISEAEGQAYAREMLRSVTLSVDGRSAPINLVEAHFPQFSDMSLGLGSIRLRATAKIPATGYGFHQISFLNAHRPEASVYLVNALVPENPRIKLADQRRDPAQHGLTLDYTVIADAEPAWNWALFAGLAGLVLAGRFVWAARSFVRQRN